MATFYFTFPASSPLAKAYMKVEANTHLDARRVMIGEYGFPIKYAFSYVEEQFLPQIERYNLYEVPFGYMPESI